MFSSETKTISSQYTPVSLQDDGEGEGGGEGSSESLEMRSSSEDDHSAPMLEASGGLLAPTSSKSPQLPKLILYFSLALALLSTINVALLPAALSKYQAYPFSDSELDALPYGDARLGLDKAAQMIPPPLVYHYSWPDRIARVSRKLKNAVWGHGVQVYVTVEVRVSQHSPSPCSC